MSEFLMPSLGADMESAVLMQWNVEVGDEVKKGEVIAEIETSKSVIEIEVFQDGIVEKLLVEEGTECKVGTPLAIISDAKTVTIQQNTKDKYIRVSPAARKKAKELGIELSNISKESIHLKDITAPKNSRQDPMRNAIAKAMSLSNKEIPHYYLSTTIDMTPCLLELEKINKNRGIAKRILPAALLIKACIKALEEVPKLNGFWIDDKHQISKNINPGIAIALRKGGLLSPALLDASTLSLDQTMQRLGDMIKRTRNGKLTQSELTKQTITITNLGDLGVEEVFGVIYPPQVAIIGFGKVHELPLVENGKVEIRKALKATLAGDHRATDGLVGAQFLDRLDKILQNPKELI